MSRAWNGHLHLNDKITSAICFLTLFPLQKPTYGIPIAEGDNVCKQLTESMVHPNQGVRHHAEGCMALGW